MVKQRHHDGHELNDLVVIVSDERDKGAGNASHQYTFSMSNPDPSGDPLETRVVGELQFQHGARAVEGSTPGLLDAALIAVSIDRYEGFQSGPFACAENAEVLEHLNAALDCMKRRADDRAARNVLGRNEK